MRTILTLVFSMAGMPLVFLVSAVPIYSQQRVVEPSRTQDAIAMDLVSQDHDVMAFALADYLRVPPEKRTLQLRTALVQALVMENKRMERLIGSASSHLGEDTHDVPLVLLEAVLELQDPDTIPVILPWMCCGLDDELIDFGKQQAFAPALKFVLDGGPKVRASAESFLWTLRMMVDYWGITSFSHAERQQLKQVALHYLSEDDLIYDWLVLTNAIALAISLQDPELLQIVESIANDEDEIRRRKITYEYGIKTVRKTASEGLAGTLQLRQYVPYEQRKAEREALDAPR